LVEGAIGALSLSKKLLENLGVRAFDSLQRKMARRDVAAAEAWAMRLALMAKKLDKKHAQRTISNLELAFPEWTDAQRQATAEGMYRHFGRVFADFLQTPEWSNQRVLENTEVIGLEHLLAAESEGKGVISVTGHFGNWERMGHWVAASGRKLTVVARDANQSGLNDRVLELRRAAGFDVLSRGLAVRTLLQKLRAKEFIGILADQNASEVFVPFFGKPCGMVKGPATLHERTGAPIVPVYAMWVAPGQYRVEFGAALEPEPGFDKIEGLSRAICTSLENQIRKYPEQWLWMHDRWKAARQRGLL
jgi:KDO2-lipid IV(A) lauroyltransferase